MIKPDLITFRKLKESDLCLLYVWLNNPHVHEWYDRDKENTLEDVTKRYNPKINGDKPTDCFITLYDGEPVAYVQKYKVNDYPEEFGNYVGYDDQTASIDLFIGEPKFIGIGFGTQMIKKFLKDFVFAGNIKTCIIGPEPKNKRAIRAYKKAGFKYVKTVHLPQDPEPSYIMELTKNKFIRLRGH